jgi:hypothetical protein
VPLQALPSQQGWPTPPQARQRALWQTPPAAHAGVVEQHASPRAPQAMHVPPVEAVVEHFVAGAEQTLPQHAWPAPPQPEHWP